MKVKVLLDIDGVIADFYASFGHYLNKTLNAGLDLSQMPPKYNLHEWGHGLSKNIVNDEVPKWVMSGGYFSVPIFNGAKEFVYKLMDKYDVHIVTARLGDFRLNFSDIIQKTIKRDTFRWLKKHGIPSNKLFFEHKKVDFCQNNNIPIIIEDKLETTIKGANKGIRCILIDRAWNQDTENQDRDHFNIFVAYNYDEILQILKELNESY